MRRLKVRNLFILLLLLLVGFLITLLLLWHYYTGSVSKNSELLTIRIEPGTNSGEIANLLEGNDLIKSKNFFKLYLKIKEINNLKAGTYQLASSMDLEEIIKILQKGNNYNADEIQITFKEGANMREIATLIAEHTDNTYSEVMDLVKDKEYLKEVIDKYWFVEEDILNSKLYYSLEGYLFPNTYRFKSKSVTVEEIFNKLLSQMETELKWYREDIENSKYSFHEILTLASVIEKEGKVDDFKNISSVFHNRLNKGMKLESCATTYYGMGLDFNSVGIANSEMIANNNPYNTYKIAKLPIGPISSVSKKALQAAIEPNNNKYLYFLSDKDGKTYFFNTYKEHQKKQQELIKAGKWYR